MSPQNDFSVAYEKRLVNSNIVFSVGVVVTIIKGSHILTQSEVVSSIFKNNHGVPWFYESRLDSLIVRET